MVSFYINIVSGFVEAAPVFFLLALWIRLAVMNLTTVIKSPLQRTDCQGYDGQMFHILQSNHLCLVWRIPKESCQLRNEVEVAWSFWSMLIQLRWSTHILQLFFKINFHFSSGDGFFFLVMQRNICKGISDVLFQEISFCAGDHWTLLFFCKCLLSPAHTHTYIYMLSACTYMFPEASNILSSEY